MWCAPGRALSPSMSALQLACAESLAQAWPMRLACLVGEHPSAYRGRPRQRLRNHQKSAEGWRGRKRPGQVHETPRPCNRRKAPLWRQVLTAGVAQHWQHSITPSSVRRRARGNRRPAGLGRCAPILSSSQR
jgi:hypothetical protein